MSKERLLYLENINERRGTISVLEDLPFKINRVFSVYNVPSGSPRGGHAHKKCHQLVIAMCGSAMVKVAGKTYILDCPKLALYIPPKHWIDIEFMSEDTVLMVLASEKYNEKDYIYGTN